MSLRYFSRTKKKPNTNTHTQCQSKQLFCSVVPKHYLASKNKDDCLIERLLNATSGLAETKPLQLIDGTSQNL